MQAIELATRRCRLTPLSAADVDDLHGVWTSPGVRRFLWDDEVIPLARTREIIEQSARLFANRGVGLWGVRTAAIPGLAGFAGLWPFRDPPELELLYGVAEPLWGQGYGTEAAEAVLRYCVDSLRLPVVRASTDAANAASIRVLEKLGFHVVRRCVVNRLDTVFYELEGV